MWEVWESLSLASLKIFVSDARLWLADRSELREWSFANADWPMIYAHFKDEACAQIDNANSERPPERNRLTDEDSVAYLRRIVEERKVAASENKWAEYEACEKCEAGSGQPCVSLRSGVVAKNAHPGRRKVAAELPSEPAPKAPAAEPVAATSPKRSGRSQGQSHALSVTPVQLAGYDTFKATCSCGEFKGSNWTTRDDAVKEHERHVSAMLVSA